MTTQNLNNIIIPRVINLDTISTEEILNFTTSSDTILDQVVSPTATTEVNFNKPKKVSIITKKKTVKLTQKQKENNEINILKKDLKDIFIDEKLYTISDCKNKSSSYHIIWNNGEIDHFHRKELINSIKNPLLWRMRFISCFKQLKSNDMIDFITHEGSLPWVKKVNYDFDYEYFLGFKTPDCPNCSIGYLVWKDKLEMCEKCEYVHAFEIEDD